MEKINVSNVVTTDEIKKWNDGNIVIISAETGSGKSYFIKNLLYAFAEHHNKKILMLIHRTNCVDQFQKEIERDKKTDIIDIKTYQYLESLICNYKIEFSFKDYDYIVCDEFHYFLSDASFNKTTDISLNLILEQTNITRILMSATGDRMKKYLVKHRKLQTTNYELPYNYNHIKSLIFFNKDETMEEFIKEAIEKNQKGIFFIESAKKAYELYKKYNQYCLFNCSKSNRKYYSYVEPDKIGDMLINEKFNELILITTTCLDAGVNINDIDLKHIVIDVEDIGSLIQCMGRKRIKNENDKFHLYIKSMNNQQLGGKETSLNKKIKMADYLRNHTVKEYIEEFPRSFDISNIVYDAPVEDEDKGTKRINELMYFKCKLDISDIKKMKEYGEFGYCKYLARLFGFYHDGRYNYIILEEKEKLDDLNEYLEKIINKRLMKDEQNELINKIHYTDYRGRVYKNIKTLNASLEEIKSPYFIVSRRTKDSNRKDFTYWVVLKK